MTVDSQKTPIFLFTESPSPSSPSSSSNPSPSRPRSPPAEGTPELLPTPIVLESFDIVFHGPDFVGIYRKLRQTRTFFRVTWPDLKYITIDAQHRPIQMSDLREGCILIRNKRFFGYYSENEFYEVPDHMKRQLIFP
ncbi:uncharacterized protein LOC117170083 [Belonocnema kinseyi]|uniref:uncharacterized protein LOC117170083 n=1 Tax=Belonocnema kinseyi TaxID=2817044 RepID=UPI00143DEFFA|nr:uncharacterized protein LOC117170083 [Belonocnema kinseyi]